MRKFFSLRGVIKVVGVGPEQLHRRRRFVGREPKHVDGLFAVVQQSFRAYHLGGGERGSVIAAKSAESHVAEPRHGRENNVAAKRYVSYFNAHSLSLTAFSRLFAAVTLLRQANFLSISSSAE